jgi:aminopeptidase N
MRWWDDLWLNESFATFMSFLATAEATRWTDAWATFVLTQKTRAYRYDQLPSTHPIVADIRDVEDVQVNFDGITYAKGASVLKQLAAYVGREPFFAGLGAYLERHAWGNATLADLLAELAAAGGGDLTAWSRAFLQTAGPNTLELELEQDGQGPVTAAVLVQTAPAEHPTLRPHRLALGCYDLDAAGTLQRTRRIDLEVTGARTPVPELVGRPRPALLLVNDDDLTYAKVRLDADSARCALEHVSAIRAPLPRALVWGALWNATRDGELPAREFLAAVERHAGEEPHSPILGGVLGQAVAAAELYVAHEHREAALVALADTLQRLALAAEPGTDAQLQLVTTLARVARTPAQLDLLAGLLTGSAALPGLAVDTDLRWRILVALVAGGAAGEAEIAATLEGDRTAKGEEWAAEARAALPTREAKEAAWRSVTESDALPNEQVRATCAGLGRVNDPALLTGLAERYVGEIERLWRARPFSIAEALARGLYPAALVTEEVRSVIAGWLAGSAAPPPLRRVVAEELADTERALAARARDARG